MLLPLVLTLIYIASYFEADFVPYLFQLKRHDRPILWLQKCGSYNDVWMQAEGWPRVRL